MERGRIGGSVALYERVASPEPEFSAVRQSHAGIRVSEVRGRARACVANVTADVAGGFAAGGKFSAGAVRDCRRTTRFVCVSDTRERARGGSDRVFEPAGPQAGARPDGNVRFHRQPDRAIYRKTPGGNGTEVVCRFSGGGAQRAASGRAAAGATGERAGSREGEGRRSHAREERVPGQHEPRNTHADERDYRHDGAGAGNENVRGTAGISGHGEKLGGLAIEFDQRHLGFFESRSAQRKAGARGISRCARRSRRR